MFYENINKKNKNPETNRQIDATARRKSKIKYDSTKAGVKEGVNQ